MSRVQSLSAALDSTSRLEVDATKERLECLLRQEDEHYMCSDYVTEGDEEYKSDSCHSLLEECARVVTDLAFSSTPSEARMQTVVSSACVKDMAESQEQNPAACGKKMSRSSSSSVSSSFVRDGKSPASNLVGHWRQQMLEWSNLVIDSFGMDREVVAVSFNILDRYVAHETQSTIPITRDDYQLFCMSSLFMAVKMLESYPRKLTADALVDMSRGFYASDDILYTEREILRALSWYVNPTTTISYCRMYWELFPTPVSFEFENICHSLSEMALADASFLCRKPSLIACAAILHAARMENVHASVTEQFLQELHELLNLQQNSGELDAIYRRLEMLMSAR